MQFKRLTLTTAAIALAAMPVAAQASQFAREAAPVSGESRLGGGEDATRLSVLALIAAVIIGGIMLFGDEDEPISA